MRGQKGAEDDTHLIVYTSLRARVRFLLCVTKGPRAVSLPIPVTLEPKNIQVYSREDDITAKKNIKWAKDRIPCYKVPQVTEFRAALPASGAGETLRRILVEEKNGEGSNSRAMKTQGTRT